MVKRSVLAFLLFGSCAFAEWVDTSAKDFARGELDKVAVHSSGKVTLAPEAKLIFENKIPYIWQVVESGGAFWVATGEKGCIYKVKGKSAEVVFKPEKKDDLQPFALCATADGVVVGYSPSGRLYALGPNGKVKFTLDTGENYIWDILPEGKSFIVATGGRGKLLRLSPKAKTEVIIDTDQAHILCLARAKDGKLYAGTSDEGLVYVIEGRKSRIVYDASEMEIRDFSSDPEGNLYFCTAGGRAPGRAPRTTTVPPSRPSPPSPREGESKLQTGSSVSVQVTGPATEEFMGPAVVEVRGPNSIYCLEPSGNVRQILSRDRTNFFSLSYWGGKLYAGSGNDGFLFRIEEDETLSVVAKLEERQVLDLQPGTKGLLVATGNNGTLRMLSGKVASDGTIVSRVYDCRITSRWGKVYWEADTPPGTSLSLFARSGNTANPGKGWSDWKKCELGSTIECPPGRFLQYKAILKGRGNSILPTLYEVRLFYLSANLCPKIKKLSFSRASPQKKTPSRQRKTPSLKNLSGKVNVSWQASDPNGDKLLYSLYFKGLGEKLWKKLIEKKTSTSYGWDTESVPDGKYLLKLVASDEASRGEEQALVAEKLSEILVLDNTPPRIERIQLTREAEQFLFRASASDGLSLLRSAEYSIDAEAWHSLQPIDGIFDSTEEDFQFSAKELEPGEHTLVIKVTDKSGNTGAGKLVFDAR